MDITQILALIIGNAAIMIPLWLWNRAESRADMRHMDNKFTIFQNEMKDVVKSIHQEMRDFHSRLLILEERYLKIRDKE